MLRRPVAVLVTAGLLSAPVAVAPATAGTGAVPSHDHRAYESTYVSSIASSAAGTVFVGFGGRVNLLRAPITAETERTDLGPAGAPDVRTAAARVDQRQPRHRATHPGPRDAPRVGGLVPRGHLPGAHDVHGAGGLDLAPEQQPGHDERDEQRRARPHHARHPAADVRRDVRL